MCFDENINVPVTSVVFNSSWYLVVSDIVLKLERNTRVLLNGFYLVR